MVSRGAIVSVKGGKGGKAMSRFRFKADKGQGGIHTCGDNVKLISLVRAAQSTPTPEKFVFFEGNVQPSYTVEERADFESTFQPKKTKAQPP